MHISANNNLKETTRETFAEGMPEMEHFFISDKLA